MHRLSLLVLLTACGSNTQAPLDPAPMMESLRISNESEECVEEAVYACIEEDGVCEDTYGDWVTCVFDNDCVDGDGFLDEFCAEACDAQADLFQTCMWEDCSAFQDCETASDSDTESSTSTTDPAECDAELDACLEDADGACAPVVANWDACAQAAGCSDVDGNIDDACALAACPTDAGAINECIHQECDSYMSCLADAYGNTGDPCNDASAECFYGDCSSEYGSFIGCIIASECIDADGFYDDFCGQENCATEQTNVGTCISSSCPDYVDACH